MLKPVDPATIAHLKPAGLERVPGVLVELPAATGRQVAGYFDEHVESLDPQGEVAFGRSYSFGSTGAAAPASDAGAFGWCSFIQAPSPSMSFTRS